MTPLDAFGLDRDADERAVKRAYARRLKSTRPDEDPAGFQKLHGQYQAALSFVEWRDRNPGATWWDDDEDDDEPAEAEADDPASDASEAAAASGMSDDDFEALIGNPRFDGEPLDPTAPPPRMPREPPDVGPAEERPEPFRLDLDGFLQRLLARIESDLDEGRLRAWLDRETADWPILVKPRVAHALLPHLLGGETEPTSEQLEVLVTHFGLDDIRTGVDPIGLEEMRERAAQQLRRRGARFAHLFDPANRDELVRYMAQPERGGYPAVATRLVATLFTMPRARRWAMALRPVPLLNRLVMTFANDLDEQRFDAFVPHIDREAFEFWQWAELRREINRGWRYLVLIGLLIVALTYVTSPKPRPSQGVGEGTRRIGAAERARQQDLMGRLNRTIALDDAQGAEAVVQYEGIIADFPPPWTTAMRQALAVAHYNKGVAQQRLGRLDDARASYTELDRIFAREAVAGSHALLVIAKGLVNRSRIEAQAGEHPAVLETLQIVLARHDGAADDEFGAQVARALVGRALAFAALGRREEAGRAVDETLRRFGDRTTDGFTWTLDQARRLRTRLDEAPAAPGSGREQGDRE